MSNTTRSKTRSAALVTTEMLGAAGDAGTGGIRFSHLVRRTNLGTARARRLVDHLVGAGLLAAMVVDGGDAVAITPRGLEFLDHCRRFMDLAESFGVEL